MEVRLTTKWHDVWPEPGYHMGAWRCCETRAAIDGKLDELKDEIPKFPGKDSLKYRSVRCTGGCQDNQQEALLDVDFILNDVMTGWG